MITSEEFIQTKAAISLNEFFLERTIHRMTIHFIPSYERENVKNLICSHFPSADVDPNEKLAVLFYIHGGGFTEGKRFSILLKKLIIRKK